jgi:hypothetical protein
MRPGAQNMKTRPDALSTAEKVFGSVKYENGTRRPPFRQKHVREREALERDRMPSVPRKKSPGVKNMKTGADALGTVENVSGSAKHENGT